MRHIVAQEVMLARNGALEEAVKVIESAHDREHGEECFCPVRDFVKWVVKDIRDLKLRKGGEQQDD